MQLHSIETGTFKLDGGAMFGVVPKSMWNNVNPADDNNMCTWSMRCMLVEHNNRLILIDNGIGDKQSDKFFSHYYLGTDVTLNRSLAQLGFNKDDITDVILTHLHFDHCGGSVHWNKDRTGYETSFKNATYWSNEKHWDWAVNPNKREKASFLRENIIPIQESGQLKFIADDEEFMPGINIKCVHGHTESMMLPHLSYKGKTVVFMADLLPSAGHIPIPYVMAYDTRPLITLDEKSKFLANAVANDYVLFFEHDPVHECCSLKDTERGVRPNSFFNLSDI